MNGKKVSVSLPKDLWIFIENEKTAMGRRGTSHVVQDALDLLRKSRQRAAKYRSGKASVRSK